MIIVVKGKWHVLTCLMFMIIISGCQSASGVSSSLLKDKDITFRRLAVMPFQQVSPELVATYAAQSNLTASVLKTDNDLKSPERFLQDFFMERMSAYPQFELVSPDRVAGIYKRVSSNSFRMTLPQVMKEVGEELAADGIIVGYLYRYRERRGYDYSVEKPASVFFEIHLYRVHDGALVWKGIFNKTQSSLMENILGVSYFIKDKGRWLTAKELAMEGMEDTVRRFPGVVKDPVRSAP
jgi:hypothetical protein